MITVAFFEDNKYTEKVYTGEACAVPAFIDMAEHIKKGGFCAFDIGNTSTMVTSLQQLGVE